MPGPRLSVIVLTRHRAEALRRCLQSVADQEGAPAYEVIVVSDDDPDAVDLVTRLLPTASVAVVPKSHPGASRNVAIARAQGELLVFLDDDVRCAPTFLADLAREADEHPEADVFGGPNLTPAQHTAFEAVQGEVLGSVVAVGPVRWRYRIGAARVTDERTLTLCNLVVRRAAMLPFTASLGGAEENRVLQQLQRQGAVMRYTPALGVEHDRRPTVHAFVRQMWKYGRGRGQLLRLNPRGARLAYVAPTALLGLLLATPGMAFLVGPGALVPALVWAVTVAAAAGGVVRRLRRWSAWPLAVLLIASVHVAYGGGVLRGVCAPRRGSQPAGSWHRAPIGAHPVLAEAADDTR